MFRAVIDVNVFISGHLNPTGAPGQVLMAVRRGEVRVVASPEFIDELDDTLHRRKFQKFIPVSTADRVVLEVRRTAEMHYVEEDFTPITRDVDDDYLVRLARMAKVDYLVSGDRDLLHSDTADIEVIPPAEFVRELKRR